MAETALPAFVRLKFDRGNVDQEARVAGDKAGLEFKRSFDSQASAIRGVIQQALAAPRNNSGALNVGADGIRAAAQAELSRAKASKELADGLRAAFSGQKDLNAETRIAILAADSEAKSRNDLSQSLFRQAAAAETAQRSLNLLASSQDQNRSRLLEANPAFQALADAENAAARGADLLAAAQKGTGLEVGRTTISARESAAAFQALFDAQDKATREAAEAQARLRELSEAEAAAARGADLLAAAQRGTGLEIGRAANSARESASAFQAAFDAQERQARESADALRRIGLEAFQLRTELDPLFSAQQRFDQELDRANRLLAAGVISQREYAQANELARQNLQESAAAVFAQNDAYTAAEKGSGKLRQATIQVGQQFQDFAIQVQGGQSVAVAFVQQASQLGFILSQLDPATEGLTGRFARFGAILSGPFGLPIIFGLGIALGVVTDLLTKQSDELENAEKSTFDFTSAIDTSKLSIETYKDVIEGLTAATRGLINTQALLIDSTAKTANLTIANTQGELFRVRKEIKQLTDQISDPLSILKPFQGLEITRLSNLKKIEKDLVAQIPALQRSAAEANAALSVRRVEEKFDKAAGIRGSAERKIAELTQRRVSSAEAERRIRDSGGLKIDGEFGPRSKGFISQSEFEKQVLKVKQEQKAAEDALKPEKKKKSGASAARQAAALTERGSDAADRIASIVAGFVDAPTAIEKTQGALRKLDDLANDFSLKKPPNYEELVAQISEARKTIEGFAGREFDRFIAQGTESLEIQSLILSGRQDEAEALNRIFGLQDQIGNLTNEQRKSVLAQVIAERQINEAIQARERIVGALTGAVDTARAGLEGLLSGGSAKGFVNDLAGGFKRLRGQLLTESIFGSTLRDLEKAARGGSGLGLLETQAERAAKGAGELSEAFEIASDRLLEASQRVANPGSVSLGQQSPNGDSEEIVVTANQAKDPIFDLIIKKNTDALGAKLDKTFGVQFFSKLSESLGGALSGFVRAGPVGAALGLIGAKGALKGAESGALIAQIGKSLGVRSSSTGGSIGGALGSIFGKEGGLIGGLFGSIIGGLFKKTPKGTVKISNTGSSFSGSGKLRSGLTGTGDSVSDTLESIAEQLGGTLGSFSTSIRQKKNSFFVGGQKFGSAQEAAEAATLQVIQQGVIAGIDAGTQRLLQSGGKLEDALKKATNFQGALDRIKESTDPLGAALARITREFGALRTTFTEAGATAEQFAGLSALEAKERKAALESVTASLRDLQRENSFGDTGRSLRDRQAAALSAFNPLEARVKAGDATAFDEFASIGRELRDINREIFGSQSGYFEFLDRLQGTTNAAIAGQENIAGLNATAAPVVSALDRQTDALISALKAVNDNTGQSLVALQTLVSKISTGPAFFPIERTAFA